MAFLPVPQPPVRKDVFVADTKVAQSQFVIKADTQHALKLHFVIWGKEKLISFMI